jgi:hypothetical protein
VKIAKLKVQNFKAFYGKYEFDFLGKDGKAKNLLIYGENGSGKSSLYWTLHHALTTTDLTIFKKYKNIFAENEDKPLHIEMDFDNGKKFVYDEVTGITVDPDVREEFGRLTKIKTFLTYESIFLINELFTRETSVERFVFILKKLYGESLGEQLNEYIRLRKDFKQKYLKRVCDYKELFKAFDKKHNIAEYWKDVYNDLVYENIPKWDKEENKPLYPFYETVYYYPDETISQLENIKSSLELLQSDFDIESQELDELISSINDIQKNFEEKSESHYRELIDNEKIFVTDFEAIETVDELVTLETYFEDIFEMISVYKSAKELIESINNEINQKIYDQVAFIGNVLKNNFKNSIEVEAERIDYLEFDPMNLDKFNPIRFNIKMSRVDLPHRHTKFLNEARISSVNFAFYISIIKSYAELKELKLLILDDLLISLDMSNRDIVLNILQEYFADFQIIFLTHDRAFYEKSKQIFDYKAKDAWKYFEMYVDRDESMEFPYIKEYGQEYGNIERAKEHFNNKDYPACANYLRKEVEQLFDKFLELDHLDAKIYLAKLKENSHTVMDISKELKKLLRVLKKFEHCERMPQDIQAQKCKEFSDQVIASIEKITEYIEDKMHFEEFEDVKLILKSILHPQSHSDITKPLYKKELEDAIKLMEEFKRILDDVD